MTLFVDIKYSYNWAKHEGECCSNEEIEFEVESSEHLRNNVQLPASVTVSSYRETCCCEDTDCDCEEGCVGKWRVGDDMTESMGLVDDEEFWYGLLGEFHNTDTDVYRYKYSQSNYCNYAGNMNLLPYGLLEHGYVFLVDSAKIVSIVPTVKAANKS